MFTRLLNYECNVECIGFTITCVFLSVNNFSTRIIALVSEIDHRNNISGSKYILES